MAKKQWRDLTDLQKGAIVCSRCGPGWAAGGGGSWISTGVRKKRSGVADMVDRSVFRQLRRSVSYFLFGRKR